MISPDQFEYDDAMFDSKKEGGEVNESKKRHELYKSRMAELQHYKKLLKKQDKKNGAKSAAADSEKTSRHIDKYRHRQRHQTETDASSLNFSAE